MSENPAPERQSSSPGCYSNLFTGNGPPQHAQIGNAGAPQGHGSTAFDQQRQLDLLRVQPSSSQARAPGCSSCGAPATRVVLKMPMCEACYRDAFMGNAPPQHAQIGSMLPSPVASYGGAVRSNEEQSRAYLEALLAKTNIGPLNIPFSVSAVGSGPICDACGRRSGSNNACQACYNYAQTGNVPPQQALAGNVSPSPVPTPSNAGAPQDQQQFRDSVAELLAATEPSPAGSQRAARSNCDACRFSGDKACMFCHNPGPPPPPPPPGQS